MNDPSSDGQTVPWCMVPTSEHSSILRSKPDRSRIALIAAAICQTGAREPIVRLPR
jgi:hypothetical protein